MPAEDALQRRATLDHLAEFARTVQGCTEAEVRREGGAAPLLPIQTALARVQLAHGPRWIARYEPDREGNAPVRASWARRLPLMVGGP